MNINIGASFVRELPPIRPDHVAMQGPCGFPSLDSFDSVGPNIPSFNFTPSNSHLLSGPKAAKKRPQPNQGRATLSGLDYLTGGVGSDLDFKPGHKTT